VVAGFAGFLVLGLGWVGVIGPVLVLLGFGLLERDPRRSGRGVPERPSTAPAGTPAPAHAASAPDDRDRV
jgi:hypothetical protein